jgi:AcrR family transcriptional regulator
MGHKHSKKEILDEALAAAFDDGLSQLTFGRLARRMGISDRIVVYYFPSKEALIGEVMTALAVRLQRRLAEAFASVERDHRALVRTAWPVLAHPDADPLFALYFEAMGLAAAGRDPYRTLLPALIGAWVDWVAGFIEGTTAERRAEAEAAIALIDGLLLLRRLAGPEVAGRASHQLGVS